MKKYYLVFAAALLLFGCGNLDMIQWEYKVVKNLPIDGLYRVGEGAKAINTINISEDELNKIGQEGWELVDSYLEMETAFPNFGKEEYHTGIKPNVRPQLLVLIFKRQWDKDNKTKKT